MPYDPFSAGRHTWQAALEQAIAHPRVQELATLLDVDLHDETRRQAVLGQAAGHLASMASRQRPLPAAEEAALLPVPPPSEITAYRVAEALRSYREIDSF